MKRLSIGAKLLWISSALFLVVVAVLSFSLWWSLSEQNTQLAEQVKSSLHQETQQRLSARAAEYGEKVAGFINEAYRIPYSFAGLIERTAQQQTLSRSGVEQAVYGTLQKNQLLSSMYAQFEPNGYDQLDDQNSEGQSHSVVGSGSLEIYVVRNNDGSIEQQQVEDSAEKYVATKDEFGIREAEWYLCAKDRKKPCLMEPYLYEISPGNEELMTSLTVPVVVDQQFKGVVGVDVNLPVFQQLIDELSASLYQGKAKVTLLSQLGLVVAASHYQDFARPLGEAVEPSLAKQYQQLDQQGGFLESDKQLVFAYPVNIPLADAHWSLLIEVDKQDAYKSALSMSQVMAEMASSLGSLLLIVGIVVSVLAVLAISIVIRSLLSPLKVIQARVENLASAEGDLTQSITVDAHAELIALGGGINSFITKLRELISQLKTLSERAQHESQTSADIAQHTRDSVNKQYQEIESVVTAVNEMSSTALEVAKASEQTAQETEAMTDNARSGEARLKQAMHYVTTMSEESLQAKDAVAKVADSSTNISNIVDVINAIAEQTNLLALNAAIEAARAGEQGRGFAVVADEVRSLASKTQNSTGEISQLINTLQSEVSSASGIIEQGVEGAQRAVEQTESALSDLNTIVSQIEEVSGQITHIATAAEEQSAVTEEVNRNITAISDSAAELASLADQTTQSSSSLAQLVEEQQQQLNKLKT
ncbi:methyl-accepting chemotaxis protein [Agarivorans gilvus]|uniref:Methyl-accepting chemotaxis protein n=1 Tax=Agarivorans gilvus TaxID=680279 RepID=A0ABQ1I423_9ALTE|nr:methyl-accepting chemotaxis protein [Agarivorans gilvus]GGB14564.1 methyl-accepting chemotaxis protein [Agarivorans gilvus]